MPAALARSLALCLATIALASAATAQTDDANLRRARELLRTTPLIDSHNDLPWVIREKGTPPRDVESYDIAGKGPFDTDIPRLRAGGIGAQFWSVYVPSTLSPFEAMRAQLEQIDIARRIIAKYPADLGLATSLSEIKSEMGRGRIASLIGMEGGHTIGNSLGALRAFYDLGARYMTLTHFNSNDWADAATDSARHGGLTPFGKEVVREMNRMGMMVDISHVSPTVMSQVLTLSEAPVIFSHSSARALTDHVRNVPDSILARMKSNGGVVMVNFVTAFVSEPYRRWIGDVLPTLALASSDSAADRILREHRARRGPAPRATVKDLADHVEHIRRVAGIDHVGIGADFYGAVGDENQVQGLEDVSKYPVLFAELIRRGWSDADLRKLAGENMLRVLGEVESVSARVRKERPPSNATIEQLDGKRGMVGTQ
ncbi:MAG: dipeptidase [Gemmatimonadetes bacterium]|nr:dipeptidase [Gemmatimonadota bacterium]